MFASDIWKPDLLVKENKGVKIAGKKGIGGKGRLTQSRVNEFQNVLWEGNSVQSGNLEEMKKAVLAIFYHYSSTTRNPQHRCYPPGDRGVNGRGTKSLAKRPLCRTPYPGLS